MPLPKKHKNESVQEFISRCVSDEMMVKDFKDRKQRLAVCYSQFKVREKMKGEASWDDVRRGDSLNLI